MLLHIKLSKLNRECTSINTFLFLCVQFCCFRMNVVEAIYNWGTIFTVGFSFIFQFADSRLHASPCVFCSDFNQGSWWKWGESWELTWFKHKSLLCFCFVQNCVLDLRDCTQRIHNCSSLWKKRLYSLIRLILKLTMMSRI